MAMDIIKETKGAMYQDRVQSFVAHNWPYADPTKHTCTPEELAMAGLYYRSFPKDDDDEDKSSRDPVGQCFACCVQISIHDFAADTSPWELHEERAPHCPYLKLGRKQMPRDYKFGEINDVGSHKYGLQLALYLENLEKTAMADLLRFDDACKMMKKTDNNSKKFRPK